MMLARPVVGCIHRLWLLAARAAGIVLRLLDGDHGDERAGPLPTFWFGLLAIYISSRPDAGDGSRGGSPARTTRASSIGRFLWCALISHLGNTRLVGCGVRPRAQLESPLTVRMIDPDSGLYPNGPSAKGLASVTVRLNHAPSRGAGAAHQTLAGASASALVGGACDWRRCFHWAGHGSPCSFMR